MPEKVDYKKKDKELYLPKCTPSVVEVPKMLFFMVDGKGNPNTCEAYKKALELLYALTFSIKMSKMSGSQPSGYFEYVVPPLEGLWWVGERKFDGKNNTDKELFCWTSMIRQPEFVTEEVFEWAKAQLKKKKPEMDVSLARLVAFEEGLCCQVMHKGSYDKESYTIEKMEEFIAENGYTSDFSKTRLHHEIYLSDPRRCAPEKLQTVIRHPIKRMN